MGGLGPVGKAFLREWGLDWNLKDGKVLARPREGGDHFTQRRSPGEAQHLRDTPAGGHGERIRRSGWLEGRAGSMCHVTGEQAAVRSGTQVTHGPGSLINEFRLYPKNTGEAPGVSPTGVYVDVHRPVFFEGHVTAL